MIQTLISFLNSLLLICLIGALTPMSVSFAQSNRVNLKLNHIDFSSQPNQKKAKPAGSFQADTLVIETDKLNVRLLPNAGPFHLEIAQKGPYLLLSSQILSFDLNTNEKPFDFLQGVSLLQSENLALTTDRARFDLSVQSLNFGYKDSLFSLDGLSLVCLNETPSSKKTWKEICLNNAEFSANRNGEPAQLKIKKPNLDAGFSFQDIRILPESLSLKGDTVSLVRPSEEVLLQGYDLSCMKGNYSLDMDFTKIAKDCIDQSQIRSFQKFSLKKPNGKLTVDIENGSIETDPEKMQIQSDLLSFQSGDTRLQMDHGSILCEKPHLSERKFEFKNLIIGCFQDSEISANRFHLSGKNWGLDFKADSFGFQPDRFHLSTPSITFNYNTLEIKTGQFDLTCNRTIAPEDLTFNDIANARGCLEESEINLHSISIKDGTNTETDVSIDSISIDKDALHINIPTARYITNGEKKEFKNLRLDCDIAQTLKSIKDLNLPTILSNCAKSSKIHLDEMKSTMDGFHWVKVNRFSSIDITTTYNAKTRKHEFTAEVHPDVKLLSILSTGTGATFKGNITFDETTQELRFEIKEKKGKILKVIPITSSFIDFGLSFIPSAGKLQRDGDTILLNLLDDSSKN